LAKRLEEELMHAEIIGVEAVPPTLGTMRSRVRYRDEIYGHPTSLVSPHEADMARGRVSILAAALLGLAVGDEIEWPVPGGCTAEATSRSMA
jgi:regulator of nucleoside diphosphate kinase